MLDSIRGVSTYNVYVDNNNRIGLVELYDTPDSEPFRRALTPEQLVELGIGLLTAANHFADSGEPVEVEKEKKIIYDS